MRHEEGPWVGESRVCRCRERSQLCHSQQHLGREKRAMKGCGSTSGNWLEQPGAKITLSA